MGPQEYQSGEKQTSATSQSMGNEPARVAASALAAKKCKHLPVIIALAVVALLGLGFGGYEFYQNQQRNKEISDLQSEKIEKNDKNSEDDEKSEDGAGENSNSTAVEIDKRLYLKVADLAAYRYYLLVGSSDSPAYTETKTYILDTDVSTGNELVKEVDFAMLLKPLIEQEIKDNGGVGNCTARYSSGVSDYVLDADTEKEVVFRLSYGCEKDGVEKGLGDWNYAYDVEMNTVRKVYKQIGT